MFLFLDYYNNSNIYIDHILHNFLIHFYIPMIYLVFLHNVGKNILLMLLDVMMEKKNNLFYMAINFLFLFLLLLFFLLFFFLHCSLHYFLHFFLHHSFLFFLNYFLHCTLHYFLHFFLHYSLLFFLNYFLLFFLNYFLHYSQKIIFFFL